MPQHPALSKDRVAVITGGASGIGLAAAKRFAAIGMKLVLADLRQDALDRAAAQLSGAELVTVPTDVSKIDEVNRLKDRAYAAFGAVDVLMNNAGTSPGGGPFDHYERWQRVLAVNLWGVIRRRRWTAGSGPGPAPTNLLESDWQIEVRRVAFASSVAKDEHV
jgi:NAD(P)-dependent dehydrogenase (short-subunit alcohol dehydrogenase family)